MTTKIKKIIIIQEFPDDDTGNKTTHTHTLTHNVYRIKILMSDYNDTRRNTVIISGLSDIDITVLVYNSVT